MTSLPVAFSRQVIEKQVRLDTEEGSMPLTLGTRLEWYYSSRHPLPLSSPVVLWWRKPAHWWAELLWLWHTKRRKKIFTKINVDWIENQGLSRAHWSRASTRGEWGQTSAEYNIGETNVLLVVYKKWQSARDDAASTSELRQNYVGMSNKRVMGRNVYQFLWSLWGESDCKMELISSALEVRQINAYTCSQTVTR